MTLLTPAPTPDTLTQGPRSSDARPGALRVLVSSPRPLLGQALTALLTHSPVVQASWCPSLDAAVGRAKERSFNMLVWVDDVANEAIVKTLRHLRAEIPCMPVCVIAKHADVAALRELISNHPSAIAVIRYDANLDAARVMRTLLQLQNGEATLSPEFLEPLVAEARTFGTLTERQGQILELLAFGLRNCEIARRLSISEKLVERHVTCIFRHLGLDADAARIMDRRVVAARRFLMREADAGRAVTLA